MKKTLKLLLLLAAALCVPCYAAAQAASSGSFLKPVVITSIGQNSDAAIIKVLLNTKLKMDAGYNMGLSAADLTGVQTIIMVLGASSKGLGAAGFTMEQEMARARALLQKARQAGIKVIALHTGGKNRRGDASNAFIALVLKEADAIIVVAGGNEDKFFDTAAKKPDVGVTETATIAEAGAATQALFKAAP